ncbi:uncharacterized protein BO97DRAFT_54631 [Aspergillus homomorphus CBS 101889]|uniref:Uncharacterized protein n=1 Tax=Aspergillus homomorphus (strain CBS 101889) TaxID=1450537 RepID=A0A395HZ33_ASPHC|nr:hypothetical protein BO97DRAFT_54631 [Aspergillus homomorphus CBS 101889]RAL12779.1 hypothetical protein BO97DRAFT_54631 [Aspergillus homomorphus CBS 101889]
MIFTKRPCLCLHIHIHKNLFRVIHYVLIAFLLFIRSLLVLPMFILIELYQLYPYSKAGKSVGIKGAWRPKPQRGLYHQ